MTTIKLKTFSRECDECESRFHFTLKDVYNDQYVEKEHKDVYFVEDYAKTTIELQTHTAKFVKCPICDYENQLGDGKPVPGAVRKTVETMKYPNVKKQKNGWRLW